MSKIEKKVAERILKRSKVGEKKYGTTMERSDLSLIEWLQHLQEELLDAAVYVEKLKQEIHYTDKVDPEMEVYGVERISPCSAHAFEEDDKRMNIIGQNGNDGLHYSNDRVGQTFTTTLYPGDINRVEYFVNKSNWSNKKDIQNAQQEDN